MTKKFVVIFGWIFVALGILGLVSNPIVGKATGAIFLADTAHSVVSLITGMIFLWVAYGAAQALGKLLKWAGVIYLIIAILGFLSSGSVFGLFSVNTADNWLDLIFGLIFIWGGWSKGNMPASTTPTQM